jgi:hypothetical protein
LENEHPEEKTWWINELNSLGVNKDNNNEELQTLENLTDDVKQMFIHEYKTSYS